MMVREGLEVSTNGNPKGRFEKAEGFTGDTRLNSPLEKPENHL